MTDLSGKVVAITGASSGIGEATALACAQAGAAVSLAARRKDRLDELAERIVEDGGKAISIVTDVGDEAQARAFVDGTQEQLGRIDVLVNNAGVMHLGAIEGAPTEEWRRMVDVNILGVLYCTHAALPHMRAQGGGHFVNVSSVGGRITAPLSGVYCLTKWGLGAFSDVLRKELHGSGIRVTLIEPGRTESELRTHVRPEVLEQIGPGFADLVPLAAEDIANAIVYAVGQPPNVDVSEMLIRPANSPM
jgi:NADP-dependent 3-hydroxy acid dehydrogenase YdfG